MARSDPQINFRIPQELKDALDAASAENRRSLTAEVVARLQASFDKGRKKPSSTYVTRYSDDPPPPAIYAELAIHAERRALSIESERLGLLQDELWAVNTWREAYYGQKCIYSMNDPVETLARILDELAELDDAIESARADADEAAKQATELPGPWKRRQP